MFRIRFHGRSGQGMKTATPHAARTATSKGPEGYWGYKKDLFSIWAAHQPAYVTTVIGTDEIGKLAVKTGVWPLKEYINGKVLHTKIPLARRKRPRIEEYLKRQGRFAHLFSLTRNEEVLEEIQARGLVASGFSKGDRQATEIPYARNGN